MIVSCTICEKPFNKPPCQVRRAKEVFCSQECRTESLKKAVTKSCKCCGKDFKIRPSEARKFSTCARKRCRRKSGCRNSNWRGGIDRSRPERSTVKYKEWRKAVFERDGYTCQNKKCGKHGGDLHADHIKPWAFFPELRYEISNGRTLCVPCHRQTYKEVFTWRGYA